MKRRDFIKSVALASPTLFEVPIAHRNDPETSSLAAEKSRKSGKTERDRQLILGALKRHPGSTSAELAEILDIDRHIPGRRLPDLVKRGQVTQGMPRMCAACRNRSVTWWPV